MSKRNMSRQNYFTIDYYDYVFFFMYLLFYRAHIDSSCITEVVTLYKYF